MDNQNSSNQDIFNQNMDVLEIDELLIKILTYICDGGKNYKIIRLVSSRWLELVGDRVDEFSNHLWTLIDKNPDAEWYWPDIAKNANTYPHMILNNDGSIKNFILDKSKSKSKSKSREKRIKIDIYASLLQNPNITSEFLQQYKKEDWLWENMVYNPSFKWEWLKITPIKNTVFKAAIISSHPNITWEIISSNPQFPWCWSSVSQNPNITIDIIKANPNAKWDWFKLSSHKNITWEMISATSGFCSCLEEINPWSWYGISQNPNITLDIINSNHMEPWDTSVLCYNHNLMLEILKIKPEAKVDFYHLSDCNKITWKLVSLYEKENWDWNALTWHHNITPDIILGNPQVKWNYKYLSFNPNLTWRFVRDNPQLEWNFSRLSMNQFTKTGKKDHHTKIFVIED